MPLALLSVLLAVQPPRPFAEERHLLDRRLETLRRILPDGPTASGDVAHIRDLAEGARLARVEVQARPPVESGSDGEVVVDVSALGGYEEIDRFFQKVALSYRLVDVESVTLTATTQDVIQLAAVVRLPFWPTRARLPPPPEPAHGRPAGVPRPALDAFLHDQSLALAKSDAIASRRRTRRTPRLFLSELAASTRERPVALGYAQMDAQQGITIRGLAVGLGPLRAFESRLERGFFRIDDFLIARQGACHRFETHGTSPVVGPDAELPVPVEDPFEQDPNPCRVDRDETPRIVVKGRTPTAKDPGRGPLTLRLRDVDLVDVFRVLSELGAGSFVVDEGVSGRTSVEVVRATLAETLDALRKAAHLQVAAQGPVYRASTRDVTVRPDAPVGGPPASFDLKRVEVRDLIAAMADIDPALAVLGPPGFLGRLSVFTDDAPLLAVRGAVLDTAGLTERTEEGLRVLARPIGTAEAPVPVSRDVTDPRLTLRPEDLTLLEFEVAGLAATGDTFVAFAYTPAGRLYAYRAGDRLADAAIRSVSSTDLTLDTEEGPVTLALDAMER